MKRVAAVLEVTSVTALTWALYKAMKLVERGGFNVSPGLAMMVVATVMLALRRRESASYGIVPERPRHGVNLGAAILVVSLLGGALVAALSPVGLRSSGDLPSRIALGRVVLWTPACFAVLFLVRSEWRRWLGRVPLAWTLTLIGALAVAAPALAVDRGAPPWEAAAVASSLVFFTGFGEELFFRGYVQSRLNNVFGRPWRFGGASFGPGLLIASLLFGSIHVFNPARPYEGHWELSWAWGARASLGGLLYGYLRELTGSIWTATIVHSLGGEYIGLWQRYVLSR